MPAPRVSFEFFPPKTPEATQRLWETVGALAPLRPRFVSVTYGAGGTTRALTHEAVTTIGRDFGLTVAAHLTCVDASRDETLAIADAYAEAGVRELVALRGDPPRGSGGFQPHPEGFANSLELIAALAGMGRFHLRVGAYPEPHPDATGPGADVAWLKRKFEAGADSAITQFFFEAETFLRFRDACAAAGIERPIIPGIVPVESWTGVRKFAVACGTRVPGWVDAAFDAADTPEAVADTGARLCIELCARLRAEGVEDLHFYTLNRAGLTQRVCAALGVTPLALDGAA